ncbi:hypothetical protein RND71_038471 [Anisodus tanguticus]|uniref:Uncharacterized protein n=1 Tax=Anisodus tanguticus TaxID=243964 RepID=A0AAE1UZH9_9SOLA|nr:hypothetical protein RND71_038471 [Anisodus tanguticus]
MILSKMSCVHRVKTASNLYIQFGLFSFGSIRPEPFQTSHMYPQAIDGIEPTRAEIYILPHTKRKDGRPLDEESSNTIVPDANSGNEQPI